MNPNVPQPSFELPSPHPVQGGEAGSAPVEQGPARPEIYSQPPAAPQPQAAQPAHPLIPQPSAPAAPQSVSLPVQAQPAPLAADDADLIEKEWVIKAKQIVAATREDPHLQNKEINRFKADYLKRRYNKDIKVEE